MSVMVTWLGHASFRLSSDAAVVYVDPWKLTNPTPDADIIFVSHSHYDHCSPQDVASISKGETIILAPAETVKQLPGAQAIAPKEKRTLGGVTIQAVAAYNVGKQFHPRENEWCGAIITIGEKKIYYAGDTDETPEMARLKDIDLALLPVGGTYTLNAIEATHACESIGCQSAIPYHWGDIVGSETDAQTFVQNAPCQGILLHPDETFTVE